MSEILESIEDNLMQEIKVNEVKIKFPQCPNYHNLFYRRSKQPYSVSL